MKHKLGARSLKFSTFMPRMLNRKRNRINSMAKVLLALFLFTFAVSQAVLIAQTNFNRRGIIVSKSKTTSSPTSQSPFEKTEKEEKHAEDKSVYFLMLIESGFLTLAKEEYSFYTDPNSWGNSAQVPLYLLIRTLLI